MTSLADRPNTAVLVIDVQNDVVAQAHDRDAVVANISALVERARAEDVPVIWVQHSSDDMPEGSDGWQYIPELPRQESEPLIPKRYGDSFEATALESELAARGVGRLIVGDAHTTDDYSEYGVPPADKVIAHTNMYWGYQDAPDRTASVVATADVDFAPAEQPA